MLTLGDIYQFFYSEIAVFFLLKLTSNLWRDVLRIYTCQICHQTYSDLSVTSLKSLFFIFISLYIYILLFYYKKDHSFPPTHYCSLSSFTGVSYLFNSLDELSVVFILALMVT